MSSCTRCGWSAPIGAAVCQRCGQPLAAASPPPHPKLILRLQSPDLPAESWEITDSIMGIGRLDSADIPIPHKSVSRQHARILPTPSGFDVEDLGSVNGTWLNDRQIADRTPLSNGDQLMIGDVQVQVELRQPAAPVATPAPLPPPSVSSARPPAGGPSTVFYDIDEALAAAHPGEVPTAHDITPTTHTNLEAPPTSSPPPPPVIIDVPVRQGPVDQATLIAGEVAEPTPPPTVVPPRPATPPPPVEPITPARRPADFVPAFEPRPATPPPIIEPRPAPPPRDVTPLPTYEPRPAPPPEVTPLPTYEPRPATPPPPSYEPRPAPPAEVTPAPTYEPRPAPPREVTPAPTYEPRPAPPREVTPAPSYEPRPAPPREVSPPQEVPALASERSATALIDLADELAAALRIFKGDAGLALWLFDHAGGEQAAQQFSQQVQRLQANPQDARELQAFLDMAPTAASLLEAASMLARVVSALGTHTPTNDESQANAPDLQPISRP